MHSIGRAVRCLQTGLPVGLSDRDDLLLTRAHTHTMPPAQLSLAHKYFASQLAAGDETLVSADSRLAAVLHFNMNCWPGGAQNRKTIRMHACVSAGLRRPL